MEKRKLQTIRFYFLIFNLLLLVGCESASINTRVYDKYELRNIKSWQIEFAYITGEEEKKETSGDMSERTVKKLGENPRDLQLIDDLIFYLKGDYHIDVQKYQSSPNGFMRIHLIKYYWPEGVFFKSLNVSLYNNNNRLIAQAKIKNGNRVALVLEDDEFAKYSAEQLSTILK